MVDYGEWGGDKLEFSGECSAYCNPKSGVKGDASPLRVEGSALGAVRRNLRTQCGNSVRSTATLRAGAQSKRPKSAKGVWGKTRVFPHKQHIVFVEPVLRNSPVDCFERTLHI